MFVKVSCLFDVFSDLFAVFLWSFLVISRMNPACFSGVSFVILAAHVEGNTILDDYYIITRVHWKLSKTIFLLLGLEYKL